MAPGTSRQWRPVQGKEAFWTPKLCSCNVTCPAGLHGVDCAQACSCHEESCDPVTGACHLGEWVKNVGPGNGVGCVILR